MYIEISSAYVPCEDGKLFNIKCGIILRFSFVSAVLKSNEWLWKQQSAISDWQAAQCRSLALFNLMVTNFWCSQNSAVHKITDVYKIIDVHKIIHVQKIYIILLCSGLFCFKLKASTLKAIHGKHRIALLDIFLNVIHLPWKSFLLSRIRRLMKIPFQVALVWCWWVLWSINAV